VSEIGRASCAAHCPARSNNASPGRSPISIRSAAGARIGVGATEASATRASAMAPSTPSRRKAAAPAIAMSISRRGVNRR
jgi:hypothetical protein